MSTLILIDRDKGLYEIDGEVKKLTQIRWLTKEVKPVNGCTRLETTGERLHTFTDGTTYCEGTDGTKEKVGPYQREDAALVERQAKALDAFHQSIKRQDAS